MTDSTSGTVQGYVDIDGLSTYYEATGDGPPLVLLHGGMCPIETWAGLVPHLSSSFRVFAPERRGHGRTADPGEITYENMAADTIAFLEGSVGAPAHLVGWSDGAVVAMLVALWRPDLVTSLVYIGNALNPDGIPEEVRQMMGAMTPEVLPPMLRQLYTTLSPDGPEHFEVVFKKLSHLWRTEPNISLDEVSTLAMPTLLVAADHDMVTTEQLAVARSSIRDAQLAIVPGADHSFPMEHPDLLAGMLHRFL